MKTANRTDLSARVLSGRLTLHRAQILAGIKHDTTRGTRYERKTMSTDPDGIRTLQALRAVEAAHAAGESVDAAIERAAAAHGLDAPQLCDRYLTKLDGVANARAALAGEHVADE